MDDLIEHSAVRGPSDPIAIGSHLCDGEPRDPSPEFEPGVDVNSGADAQLGSCRACANVRCPCVSLPEGCPDSVGPVFKSEFESLNQSTVMPSVNPSAVQTPLCRCGGRVEIGEFSSYALGIVTTNWAPCPTSLVTVT